MDLSNEEKRFWAEVKNFENGESDHSINVKTWLRGKNFGWHKNHHKNIIPTDEGHFDEETNDTMVHVELREWYKNHFRDENSTEDDSFEEVRNSNDKDLGFVVIDAKRNKILTTNLAEIDGMETLKKKMIIQLSLHIGVDEIRAKQESLPI